MNARTSLTALLVVLGIAACGGTTSTGDASAPEDGQAPDASPDAPPPPGSVACGATTCGAGEYCVTPCCGGVAPQCLPQLDGGGCPPGTTFGQCFGGAGGFMMGCSTQCKPPPPFCSKVPKCPDGQFSMPDGQTVRCQCA
jgi:hypothetical protein